MKKPTFEYTWIIDDFSSFTDASDSITSEEFSPDKSSGIELFLELEIELSKVKIRFVAGSTQANTACIHIDYKCSILNKYGDKCYTVESTEKASLEGDTYDFDWKELVSLETLKDELKISHYLPMNQLKLFIQGSYSIDLLESLKIESSYDGDCINDQHSTESKLCCITNQFSQNFGNLFESGKFSDITFAFPDGKEIRAHKQIISAQSPVFETMFAYDNTKEAKENRVEITDIDSEIFKALLEYMYTGHLALWEHIAVDLFIAADKYQVETLKAICDKVLSMNMNNKNAADMCRLSVMLNTNCLQEKSFAFLHKKLVEDIEGMKGKRENLLQINDLMVKLMEKDAEKSNQGDKSEGKQSDN